MGSRLLVVAPSTLIEEAIRSALPAAVEVSVVRGPGEAVRHVIDARPDAVITHAATPVDGARECEMLRALGEFTLIVVWERLDSSQLAACLDAGADGVIPLQSRWISHQLAALLKRPAPVAAGDSAGLVIVEDLTIDEVAHTVSRAGRHINLTPIEFRLLLVLARKAGSVVPVREILSAVWGPEYEDDVQYVRLYIGYLRAKLERGAPASRLLHTQWGIGYRLGGDHLPVGQTSTARMAAQA